MVDNEIRCEVLRRRRMGWQAQKISKEFGINPGTTTKILADRKRLVVIADLHSGHRAGLTPPDWQWHEGNPFQAPWAKQQKEMWAWYTERMRTLQPIDRLVVNADAIEGKGPRSGGTELITADRTEQVSMAAECIRQAHAPKIILTRGTPYHVGQSEDWENELVRELRQYSIVEIHDQAFPKVEGIQFHIKHFSGSSSVPHGRTTALARAKLWNTVWAAEAERQPEVNIFIRSHTHYFNLAGGANWLAISTPCLQGWGSKFGQKKCEGTVDTGLLWFDIPPCAESIWDIQWFPDIPRLATQKVIPKEW